MDIEKRIKEMDNLINSFICHSRRFVEYAAFPDGLLDILLVKEKNSKLTYDFEYFAFTKSTKTLISIRDLIKKKQNEDAFILIRSIFENYLATRYFNENSDKIDNFISNPVGIALNYYNVVDGVIKDRAGNEVGELENPSSFKMGSDKKYYYDFYNFLSEFSHCNFGVVSCFMDTNGVFSLTKVNYKILVRFFALFTFTRLFEHVVTIEGEDFPNRRTERKCYKLAQEANLYLEKVAEEVIQQYSSKNASKEDAVKFKIKRMKSMIKGMKKALKEEVGSLEK